MSDGSGGSRGGGCFGIVVAIAWIAHWIVTDVPRTSDAGFLDGLAQGLSFPIAAVARTFGAAVGVRDHFAGVSFEVGLALGACALLAVTLVLIDTSVTSVIAGGVSRERLLATVIATGVLVLVGTIVALVADHPLPPDIAPEEVPPFAGVVPGPWWHGFAVVAFDVYALIFVLALGATIAELVRRR